MPQAYSILHLSDLHFGPHSRFHGLAADKLGRDFAQAMKQACAEQKLPDLRYCIATGDIAEAGRPKEFDSARQFFKALAGSLGIADTRCLFLPGNHDVSWSLTKQVDLQQGDEDFDDAERDRRYLLVKLKHFDDFIAAFYGKERKSLPDITDLGYGAFAYLFPDDELCLVALNTCEQESHRRQGGLLGQAQAQAAMNLLLQGASSKLLKIVALHHNPLAPPSHAVADIRADLQKRLPGLKADELDHYVTDLAGFEGLDRLRALATDCRVSAVLHGHQHAASQNSWPFGTKPPGQTYVLSAGSSALKSGKLPQDEPTTVQILSVVPDKRELRLTSRVYSPRARLAGQVEPGTFAVDPTAPTGKVYDLGWPPPSPRTKTAVRKKAGAKEKTADGVSEFAAALRDRLRNRHHRWEFSGLGAIQPPGRPIDTTLDDMYLPLRVHESYDLTETQRGVVLDVGQVLAQKSPLALVGVAGAGKTTWTRWIFRRLLDEPTALPLMIELRKLAADWSKNDVRGAARTLEKYLETWLAGEGLDGFADQLIPLFSHATGPRPVLLIDGWDELGALGSELRDKLAALLSRFPRVLAVVSSRPWGESRPSSSDRFETLYFQPLSDDEILRFGAQFHRRVHCMDEVAAQQADGQFKHSLSGAPDASALARTPLLLTMMLMISRDRPLPDKRHRLYQVCMECLLMARPQDRERDGVQLGPEQWAPQDSAERMRAVGHLAFSMQSDGYRKQQRRAIVRKWDEVAALLPTEWNSSQRNGFLAWLVGAAGVLSDRADGSLSFAHLSFQEFLCAFHLLKTREGEPARLRLCEEYQTDRDWWETLRLWAAQLHDDNPEHLDPVLKQLVDGEPPAGFWLVGAMLADGVGKTAWQEWQTKLPAHFHTSDAGYWEDNRAFWRVSRQIERKQDLQTAWPEWSNALSFLSAQWAHGWAFWKSPMVPHTAARLWSGRPRSKGEVGESRVMFSLSPTWPIQPMELMLLRALPGVRGRLGRALQTASALGATVQELRELLQFLLLRPMDNKHAPDFVEYFASYFARDFPRGIERSFADDLARDFALCFARDFTREFARNFALYFARYFARDLAKYFARELARYLALDLARDFARDFARDLARDFARDFPRHWALHFLQEFARDLNRQKAPAWLMDYALLEFGGTLARGTLRSLLARAQLQTDAAELRVLQLACRSSLGHRDAKKKLQQSLKTYSGVALWPALARHVACISTDADKQLLAAAITHPEQYPAPLSHGLACYWRGDLILADGSELQLDALTDELGLPRLPLLEDYPPDIDLPKE